MEILEIAGSGTVGSLDMGPVSTIICSLANAFAHQGHNVTVVDASYAEHRPRLAESVRLVTVVSHPRAVQVSGADSRLARLAVLTKRWRNEYRLLRDTTAAVALDDFDVVHVHDPISACLLRYRYRVPYVYTAHTPTWCIARMQQPRRRHRVGLGGRVMIMTERCALRGAALGVALGDYLRSCVPDANIETIANGLDFEAFQPLPSDAARAAIGLSRDDFVVLFIGRIDPIKGVDVLIEAVGRIVPRLPQLKVLVIGSLSGDFYERERVSPYAAEMMQRAKDLPIEFLGFIGNRTEEFRRYVSAADTVAVPSRSDAQPTVVLEALAMGKPVIGARIGGIPAMLNERVGMLFPPGDAQALGERIESLCKQPQRLQNMQRACRMHVQERYTWQQVATRYLDAFARYLPCNARGVAIG